MGISAILSSQLAYAGVEIKENVVSALLDSGSFVNVISREMLQSLYGFLPLLTPTNLTCASVACQNLDVLGTVKLKIRISSFTWYVNFVVVSEVAVPIILGAPFFQKTGLCLDFRSRVFYFQFKPFSKFEFVKFSPYLIKSVRPQLLSYLEPDGGTVKPTTHSTASRSIDLEYLSPGQNQQLRAVVDQFGDVLTPKLGECTLSEYHIELIDNTPVRRPPYRLSPPKVHVLREKVQEMLDQGIIRPSTSNYSSPIFLVPKGENDFRPVIDYRYLNSKISIESIPLPDVHSAFAWFGGARIFTSLDLNQAYYQIPLSEDSKRCTAFCTDWNLFEFNKVPFGLATGAQVLTRILDQIFHDVKFKYVYHYLDDLVI